LDIEKKIFDKNLISKLANIIFYTAFSIELIIVILDKSYYIIQHEGVWFRITFLLFGIKILLTKYSKKEWLAIFLFCILGFISYYITGRNEVLRAVVLVASMKDINYRILWKYLLYGTAMGMVILVTLSFFDIGIFKLSTDFGRGYVETRYAFGMGHPNAFHCMLFALMMLVIYAYKESVNWIYLAVFMIINVAVYFATTSRTGVITITFLLIFVAVTKYYPNIVQSRVYLWGSQAVIILSMIITFMFSHPYIVFMYLRELNALLSQRLFATLLNIQDCNVFHWLPFSTAGRYEQSDLGFVKMIYWYGYIPVLIFFLMSIGLVHVAYKKKDYMAIALVCAIMLYTNVEGHITSVYLGRNYMLFLFGMYWPYILKANSEDNRYFWRIITRKN